MSGCNYFDYLSPDEIAEFDAMGDQPAIPAGPLHPVIADEERHIFFPSGTGRMAA